MRFSKTLVALPLLAATAAFALSPNYTWDRKKIVYNHFPDERCILRLNKAYQPGGEHQPIHVDIKNDTRRRLEYKLALSVDGADAGTITVDNINGQDSTDRDASKRFYGTVAGSTLTINVVSCTVRPD